MGDGAVSTREDKLRDERDRLYRAGWAVIRRNGYAEANITDILAEAKLGTRAFYRQFESKDDLLVEMFRDSADATARRLTDQVDRAGSPTDRVDAWIDAILDLGDDPRHGEIARMFTSPAMRALVGDAGDEVMAEIGRPLRAALADGVSSGEFARCDPDHDAATIHAVVWRLALDAMHGRSTLTRSAARAHVERFVHPALGIEARARP